MSGVMRPLDVTQALLDDGWHDVDKGSYSEMPSPRGRSMFTFAEKGRVIEGPVTSVLALRA
jgi:hypothetical protein